MTGYHVTTHRKLARYNETGGILPPVRFWRSPETAEAWRRKTGRDLILVVDVETAYPMPDHQPPMMAWWTPFLVRTWTRLMAEVDAKAGQE